MTKRWILRNVARRPVEIHGFSGKVVVLPAHASTEVSELDAHCLALVNRGVLSMHEISGDVAPPAKAAATAPGKEKSTSAKRRPKTGKPRPAN